MIIHRINFFLKSLLLKEKTPENVAFSTAFGIYIAFSPFVGFHTLLTIALARIFQFNFAIAWIVSHCINNPWTMIPIYSFDYWIGNMLFGNFWHNPSWMTSFNSLMHHYLGMPDICLWTFLLGGNIVALVTSLMLYPVLKKLCGTLALDAHHTHPQG